MRRSTGTTGPAATLPASPLFRTEGLRLLAADQATFQASTDPLMQAAARLLPAALREEDADKQLAVEMLRLRPSYMKGLIGYRESQGRAVYPDANSTLRVAFGTVIELPPRDAVRSTPGTTATRKGGVKRMSVSVRVALRGHLNLKKK